MGLFGKRPAAPKGAPPASPAPPPNPNPYGDPLLGLLGLVVDEAAYADSTLTLTFKGAAGEAHLEAYGQFELSQKEWGTQRPGGPGFDSALAAAPGRRVLAARMEMGQALIIELEEGLTFIASLQGGTYPGDSAVYLKGPGRLLANFNENGSARLTL